MGARIQGRQRLERKIAALAPATRKEITAQLPVFARELITDQQMLVPVDEGDLAQSIRMEPGRTLLSVKVVAGGTERTRKEIRKGSGVYTDTALAMEFGNSRVSAQPFFFPPWRAHRKRIRRKIANSVRKVARNVAKEGGPA